LRKSSSTLPKDPPPAYPFFDISQFQKAWHRIRTETHQPDSAGEAVHYNDAGMALQVIWDIVPTRSTKISPGPCSRRFKPDPTNQSAPFGGRLIGESDRSLQAEKFRFDEKSQKGRKTKAFRDN